MTQQQAKDLLPIITAFAEGKEIESRAPGNSWFTVKNPKWYEDQEYRIKPTPKLRPFRRGEIKCGAVVKNKSSNFEYLITVVKDEGVRMVGEVCYETLLSDYTMLDGSPCGVEEQP